MSFAGSDRTARTARAGAGLLVGAALAAGCGGGGSDRAPEVEAAASRLACAFEPGSLARDTVGREHPVGDAIPIDHFIVIMLENRSFDHYFGTMPGVDGIPANASNPDATSQPVAPYHETEYCIDDVHHSWSASHTQYGDGRNDGFVVTNDPAGRRAMGYFDETDLPYYHALYGTFAMSQRHFCSVLGPTWVNRWFMLSGTSFGRTSNTVIPDEFWSRYGEDPYNVYMQLEQAGVPWGVYFTDAAYAYGGYGSFAFNHVDDGFYLLPKFYEDLEAGTLPNVTFVEPSYFKGVDQTDEHPPANPQAGQAFVAQVVDAVMQSDLWSRSAILITYDEHGGFYDHVPPPSACPPDDDPPIDSRGNPVEGAFDRYGFRVPLVVVSPYAKAGYVSDRVTDHASILRLIQLRFGLPAMTRRDANAWPLLDLFEFENPPFRTPPTLTQPAIDPAKMATCRTEFP